MPNLDPFWLDAKFGYIGKSLWKLIQGMDPLRSDVVLAVLATFAEPRFGAPSDRPLLKSVMVTADTVLRHAGTIKRKGNQTRLKRRIGLVLDGLADVVFDIGMAGTRLEASESSARHFRQRTRGSRLFNIVRLGASQTDRALADDPVWYVRAGQWAYWGPDAAERRWICQIAKVLLALDYRNHADTAATAVDIARHILAAEESRPSGRVVRVRVDQLLRAIGAVPAAVDFDDPGIRLLGRHVDQALAALDEAGLFQAIGTKPELRARHGAPPNSLAETWLASDVTFVMPAPAAELNS